MAKHLKGASSHLAAQRCEKGGVFRWQIGYGALSVSVSHVRRVAAYIENQKQHHAEGKVWPAMEATDTATE